MSLYEAVVPTFLQILRSSSQLVDKARAFAAERDMPEADLLGSRLADDMRPLAFQFHAAMAHSAGAIAGAQLGQVSPDRADPPASLAELADRLGLACQALDTVSREAVDALRERPVVFAVGESKLHFTGETYLLSFAQPNFFFHATTAYGILRHLGVPIGKGDFLGQLRRAG